MSKQRLVTTGGSTGVGCLLLGVSVPDMLHGTANWLTLTFIGLGVACLAFAFIWSQIGDDPRATQFIVRHFFDVEKPERLGIGDQIDGEVVPAAKRRPEMPIWKAVEHVRQSIGDKDLDKGYPEARRRIRQDALDAELEVWGREEIAPAHLTYPQGASDAWSKIEPEYWKPHELNFMVIREETDDEAHTWTEGNKLKIGDRYWSLRVRKSDIANLYGR